MGFLNTAGLFALISLPIILILYMLRPKNRPHTLPSLYLWKTMAHEIESASKLQKLRSSLLMILQMLLALLLTLMLAGFFIKGTDLPKDVILFVDASVSMKSEDVDPSRLEYAKEQAILYMQKLDKDARISLIALKDIPEILLTGERDKSLVERGIRGITAIDAYSDFTLAQQTAATLTSNQETEMVYFGDRQFPGAQNVSVLKTKDNIGVHRLAYTIYEEAGEIRALADLTNESTETVMVPVSLYADDLFLDAKQIEMEPEGKAKVFFENIPMETKELKLQIDRADNLEVDNTAYTVVSKANVKKAVLVTTSNTFLEKFFKLKPDIQLYKADPKDIDSLKGFDLYIFDGSLPENLPEDGSILLFDPPKNTHINTLGYARNPELYLTGSDITAHLNNLSFLIGYTQIYEVSPWADSVIETEYGSAAIAGNYHNVRIVSFGFDLHNTDLPLVIDFPIILSNVMDYLIPSSMLESTSLTAGEAIRISILPSTTEAYILTPDGNKETLEISKGSTLYKNTNQVGLYSLVQKTEDSELIEKFGINVPEKTEGLEALNQEEEKGENLDPLNQKSLLPILGLLALTLLLAEWFLYHHRRKIHGVTL